VLFIPGNSGSFKQSRSLASVALRKGIDNDWFYHLDYFTVDLNEEYSALFGGVLEDQSKFIEHSIKAILKLYKRLPHPPNKIVIIAHSIGGKLAQKIMTNPETAQYVGAIITLASPMDKPVISWDVHIKNFYETIDNYWTDNRLVSRPHNNSCGMRKKKIIEHEKNSAKTLDDKLLITIGGGNKDLLVHSGLTNSKFSDLHVMTSEMSKVWLESDHLCIVWCLQLVLVVNRFLYSIIAPTKYSSTKSKGLSFIDDKALMIAKAEQHFLSLKTPKNMKNSRKMESPDDAEWFEDNRRIFTEKFKNGLNRTRIQMIRLVDNALYTSLRVEAYNLNTDDWIFGCAAIETNKESRFCSNAAPISKNFITRIPSEFPDRILLKLNLHRIKERHPQWTHVLLRFTVTKEPLQYTIDIHNPTDRQIKVTMPKWYSFGSTKLLDDTLLGASYYQFNITGMDETHQALELIAMPKYCTKHRTVGKVCIPWTEGFNRYHHFANDPSLVISTPKSRPLNYNTSENPLVVEVYLDPTCRYSFTIRQSLSHMLARIAQQFTHWLPAHLVAILCLSIKHQITLTPIGEKFKCGSLHRALATCSPFFIITVSRIFFKFILMFKLLPKPEVLPTSLLVSILIHGSSLALIFIVTVGVWTAISFSGSMAHKFLFRLVHMPIPMISDTIVSIIEKFPASVAILLISLAFGSCGGIALIVACIVYFILVSKKFDFNTTKLKIVIKLTF
jgi:GPI inositol-deacylase